MEEKTIRFKDILVHYYMRGEGPGIVFLHGYLESAKIWSHFIELIPETIKVICIDLPGHGKSGIWGNHHSMEDLAGAVREVIDTESLRQVFLAGHSMGGYVTMAFADLFKDRLWGTVLFHSTCYADNELKKGNRDREISLVHCGKKQQIINVNIPKSFADDNLKNMKKEVLFARKVALECPDRGIIALLNGMKNRPDRSHILADPGLPLLLIGGMKDNYIPLEVFDKLVSSAPHAVAVRLLQSGHMGFLEEPAKSVKAILDFVAHNHGQNK